MPSIGYLGPPGTFTEEALQAHLPGAFSRTVPYSDVPAVLLAVQARAVDSGIVPIENSIEGSVNVTLDTLAFETDLLIEAEIVHPISQQLLARRGVRRMDISGIVSHPQATAQCRRYLSENFPAVRVTAANSTAEAAQIVSKSDEPLAAIATGLAADLYGLEVLARDVEDFPHNATRFIVAGRKAQARTGSDKTSMVCFIQANRPGSLLEILTEFASRGINLTKIESRPTRKVLGEYFFFIDVEGHRDDDGVGDAIESLRGKLRELKLLGSYPAAH
jgi:prephenate dehydratase